jgi:hypothetical protein
MPWLPRDVQSRKSRSPEIRTDQEETGTASSTKAAASNGFIWAHRSGLTLVHLNHGAECAQADLTSSSTDPSGLVV